MRIGFYAPLKPPDHPAPSGDRRVARLLVQALTGMGHNVDILSQLRSYNKDGGAATESETATAAALEVDRIAARWRHDHRWQPDVLFTYHVYHKAADYIAPALKQRFDLPYIIAEPSVAPKREHGPWAAGYAQAGRAIRAADVLLSMTTLDRACLAEFAGATRVTAFPPFIDPGPFATATTNRDHWRTSFGGLLTLPMDQPWLLAVGMMRSGDKLASFRRLAAVLHEAQDLPWHLVLAGDGPERGAVETAFASIHGRVSFAGQMEPDALAGLYAASDLYVWPAVNEAYGMALLEAQACGLPVLSVNTRGVPDVVQHGKTGWLTVDDSVAVMTTALRKLLSDTDGRHAMGRAARINVARQLSITAAQERLAAIFIRLGLRS